MVVLRALAWVSMLFTCVVILNVVLVLIPRMWELRALMTATGWFMFSLFIAWSVGVNYFFFASTLNHLESQN